MTAGRYNPAPMPRKSLLLVAGLGLAFASSCAGGGGGGAGAPRPASVITNIGSDTMVNLALAWAEAYADVSPATRISVTGGGSGTGIGSLVNGTADIANASRQMKREEMEAARARGVDPEEVIVARDAIAVVIHPGNPVRQLTLQELSDIFSGKITNWRQVGGEDRPIIRVSREVNSGTHVYFLEEVIRLGQKKNRTLFAQDTLLLPSSEGITMEVSQNPNAIGYDGLGYVTEAVKMVAVGRTADGPFVLPSVASVLDKSYPVSRDLYMYTRRGPAPDVRAYLEWIHGDAAQKIVEALGFIPAAPAKGNG